jgi:hypothetical protein
LIFGKIKKFTRKLKNGKALKESGRHLSESAIPTFACRD